MRSKTFTIVFTAIFLASVAVGSIGLVLYGYSTYSYFDPYSYVPTRPASSIKGMGMTQIANYTVIFVLDGVRRDTFYSTSKPNIASFGEWANFTNVQCSTLTSVSKTGYALISSGVNSTESQVTGNEYEGEFKADSLWNATIRHSGTTAVVGDNSWLELFRPWLNYSITFKDTTPGEASTMVNVTNGRTPINQSLPDYHDSLVSLYAGQILEEHKPTFMVAHFTETDEAGHMNGSTSESYINALKNEDTYLGEILSKYQSAGILDETLIIVTADHGHVDRGGHGGTEPEVLNIPVLIRGPGVNPGEYAVAAHQNSIAPTVAALMGWEVPSDCSGTVLFEGLSLTPKQVAIYRINLAEIHLVQANITLQKTGFLASYQARLDEARQYLADAKNNFNTGNYDSAKNHAISSATASLNVLRSSLNDKVSEEVNGHLVLASIVIVIVVVPGAISFYKWRSKVKNVVVNEKRFLAVTALSVAVYFAFLMAATILIGWKFSASYFPESVEGFILGVFIPTLAAFVPAGIVLLALLEYLNSKTERTDARTVTWAAVFLILIAITYVSAVLFFVVKNGPGLPWYAPDVNEPLKYFFIAVSGMAFGVFAIISFLGGLGLTKLLRKKR